MVISGDIVRKIISDDLRLAGEALDRITFNETVFGLEAYAGKVKIIIYEPANIQAAQRESDIISLGLGLKPGQSTYASGNKDKFRWYAIVDNS